MRSAVLDLGSNSFHVLVADLDGRSVTPVQREREMLHLGRVVAQHGHVPDDDRDRAIATVAHLGELARRSGAEELLAVATSALRDAANGDEVLAALGDAAGTTVRVLDGDEEARLAYLGVRAAIAVRAEPTLVLDLGGGSLEFAVGTGERVVWSTSTPLGVSRLSALLDQDPPRRKEVRGLLARVDEELDALADTVRDHLPGTVVAVGGTVRALARVAAAAAGTWLPATVNHLELRRDTLERLRDQLVGLTLPDRVAVPGMKESRADHVHVAALVLTRVLERCNLEAITVSDWGLREGLLLDAHGVTTPPTAAELRRDEVERLRGVFVPDDPHPPHVATLALRLFDVTQAVHGLDDVDRELLGHAARLHAIGESVALRRQQLHGAYLVENAELRGFTPAESALLTVLVRFHRSRGIDAAHPAYATLTADDRRRAQRLLALLQVADGLDRARDQAVTSVDATVDDGVLELVLDGDGLHVTSAELDRKTRLFAREFDVEVRVTDLART